MITVYGIKTCDTCRKALKWLDGQGIEHRFHEFRTDGLTRARIRGWIEALGLEAVLNRRSTTWRQLTDNERDGLDDAGAAALMERHPTLVKRPVFETGKTVLTGFTDKTRAELSRS